MMNNVTSLIIQRFAFAALVFGLLFTTAVFAQSTSPMAEPLTASELLSIMQEINAMIKTDDNQVPDFVVREATPARIEQLYNMPDITTFPKIVRENGLIFAGLRARILTFNKPSDVLAKISRWFPIEMAEARAQKSPMVRSHTIRSHVDLFGPYENWDPESTAFITLWKCMPQNAWLNPAENPFRRRYDDSPEHMSLAAGDSSYEEYDFGFCVRTRAGYRPSWTEAELPINREAARKIGETATPVLRSKFSDFLSRNRCRGTGPDDCVLLLHLWASLAPSDTNLADALQNLEADVLIDHPLPELQNPNADWMKSKLSDGQARFDESLRRVAFLRAKLLSVLEAPQNWPSNALANTFHQMSLLRRVFVGAYINRYYLYQIDYRNDPINPWRVIDATPETTESLQPAMMAELTGLSEDTDCEVFKQWFDHGGPALQTRYVLDQLRRNDGRAPRCGVPDFKWLRHQESTDFRGVFYSYLALLEYLPTPTRNFLRAGLTNEGQLCLDKSKVVSTGWLRKLCEESIPGR